MALFPFTCLGGATSGEGAAGSDDGICATFGVAKAKTEGDAGRGGGAGRGRKSVTAVWGVKSLSERNPFPSHSSCFLLRFMASRTSFLATSTSPNTSDKIRTRRRANRRRKWSDPASGGILGRRRRDARRAGALHEHRIRSTSSRRDPAATASVLGPVWSDTLPSGGDISPTGRGFSTARPSAAGGGIHRPAGSTGGAPPASAPVPSGAAKSGTGTTCDLTDSRPQSVFEEVFCAAK